MEKPIGILRDWDKRLERSHFNVQEVNVQYRRHFREEREKNRKYGKQRLESDGTSNFLHLYPEMWVPNQNEAVLGFIGK